MTSTPADAAGVIALRTTGSTLIELPFHVGHGQYPWAASTWPDPGPGNGWARELWRYDHARRGWTIPASCTHGTVIELGAATNPTRRRPTRTVIAWYSVALAHDQHWLVCTNPFLNPADAYRHACGITDRYRAAVIERHRLAGTDRRD
jgi:hypothetical protein